MKKYKKYIQSTLKCFLITFGMAVFSVLLLPSLFLAIHPDKPSQPSQIFHHDKIKTPDAIKVYRTAANIVEEINFEDYVKGVVAGEMPSSFEEEALRAQAVTARTYSLSKVLRSGEDGNPEAHPAAPLCDSTHCQVYRSPEDLKQIKSAQWMGEGWPKIENAAIDTNGILMYYQGELVEQALFHSSSGGKTENSEDVFVSFVPYLRSVESPYEEDATHQNEQTSMSITSFADRLKKAYPSKKIGVVNNSNIKILKRSNGGRVEEIKVGGATLTGRNIRDALGLSSANFSLSLSKNSITITTSGYGHGVGMSQYGANGMAKEGYNYKQILSHYYRGIEVY